jgi:Putative Ig domain
VLRTGADCIAALPAESARTFFPNSDRKNGGLEPCGTDGAQSPPRHAWRVASAFLFCFVMMYLLLPSAALAQVTISPTTLPDAVAGVRYSQNITATGSTGPYAFAITNGSLPLGLTLAANGVLSGTPTAAGSFNFTVTATDSASSPGSRAYVLIVAAPALTLSPASGALSGTVGTAFAPTFTVSGGTSPYIYSLTINSGAMPTGLSFAAGVLSGTPTSPARSISR